MALLAALLLVPLAPPGAQAAPDESLGRVTGFSVDKATATFDAGRAKVRVVFLKDDVFRVWLAPDGTFTDPANTPPEDPNASASTIVVKKDYPTPVLHAQDKGAYYSLRTDKAEVRAYKDALRFALHRPDGSRVWAETTPLTWANGGTTQSLTRTATEQFLGGGMQNGRFSHRDQTIRVSRDFDWDDGGNPNASPYYMSTAGYGVLRNTFAPGSYAFKEPVATTHQETRFDAYYFVGDLKTSLDRYTELTGRPFLPPIYGLEYGDSDCYNRGHYRPGVDPDAKNDWKYHPDKEITTDAGKVAQRFADEDMPRGWMLVNDDYGCGYSADRDAYQENPGGVEKYVGVRDINALTKTGDALRAKNIQMGLWTESSLDKQPEEVGQAGVRVRKLDVAWVGPGYRHALSACDTAYNGIEQHSDARGYSWMVEGWAGAQRCAVQWTGDHSGTLGNIPWQIPAIHGSGNSGIAYTAGDVDGIFGGSATSYVRDLQWKVFTPALMTMSGWSTPKFKQPWVYGEPYTSINRSYLKLRERLLPYLYSYADQAHRTGTPIARSLVLEYPDDPKTWDDTTKYEFMAGRDLLVAPMWDSGEVKNGIYLPKGLWTDYWTGRVYQGPTTVDGYHAPLDRLPLFARAGGIVPMFKDGINSYTEHKSGDRLTLDVYPEGRSSFDLYEDDGVTRQHRTGKSATQRIDVAAPVRDRGDVTVRVNAANGTFPGKAAERPYELVVHTGQEPRSVDNLPKLKDRAEYDKASTGWFYSADKGGVAYVKTAPMREGTVVLRGTSSVGGGNRVTDGLGVPGATSPELWNPAATATEVTATFRNAGTSTMHDVRLTPSLPEGWTAAPASFGNVQPGRTVSAKIPVTPAAGTAGEKTIRIDATYRVGNRPQSTSTVLSAVVPYASISSAANTVGITDAGSYGSGRFDAEGNSFVAERLAEQGYKPGAPVTVNKATFTWPSGAPGTPNTVRNVDVPILVSGQGTHLAVLASGSSTKATGAVTVLYTDGTRSPQQLQVPNWSFQDAGTGGSKLAVAVKGRYTPNGLANTEYDYRVFYNTIPLDAGKTVKAVKLPATSDIGFFAATIHNRPLPDAPRGEAWASDVEWISATNGWGPVERDRSNGESAGGDGAKLTLNGVTYDKGLGVHAPSEITYNLDGRCTRFTAQLGVDDEVAERGSVVFTVKVDDKDKFTSPTLTGASATVPVDVDLTDAKKLTLSTTDAGNGTTSDHADWAAAKVTCAA